LNTSERRKPKGGLYVNKVLRLLRIVMLVSLTVSLCGCALSKKVVLNPIEGTDIVTLKQGETLTAPKDGAFFSSEYIEDVLEVKLEVKLG
jgi:hypothetical protein